jgi:cholesterol transport system auxiliary component
LKAFRPLAAALCLLLAGGCGALLRTEVSTPPHLYSLAAARIPATPSRSGQARAAATLTLTVSPPHAAAGFDSPRMMYTRRPGELEYFAQNEWIDTPARMLAPLIVAAIENSGAFRAVVQMPSAAAGDLRLDTEILRLQQDFLVAPSRVRFALRAYLVVSATRQVIATREFEAAVAAASENPLGGVEAAHAAVREVLANLAVFCAEATRAIASAPTRGPSTP